MRSPNPEMLLMAIRTVPPSPFLATLSSDGDLMFSHESLLASGLLCKVSFVFLFSRVKSSCTAVVKIEISVEQVLQVSVVDDTSSKSCVRTCRDNVSGADVVCVML